MLGLLTGLLGGAVAPLFHRLSRLSATLLRKVALFLVAGLCGLVVVTALTHAFELWITELAGPIVGSLAVAGVYLVIAACAVVAALRGTPAARAGSSDAGGDAGRRASTFDAQVDQFSAPLLRLLQRFGLRRELLAVLAGTSVAKRLGPIPLVGLAIVAGFLVGRMWKNWRGLFTSDAVMGLVGALGLFGGRMSREAGHGDDQTA